MVRSVPVKPEPAPPTTTAAVAPAVTEAVAATASPAAPVSTAPADEKPVVSFTAAPTPAPSVPTTPVSTTPPTGAPSIPAPLTAAQADRYFRDYYAAVEAGDYETSWSQLAPEFQRGRARSFDYYVSFWEENDIEVGEVELVASDARYATVHVDLSWNDTNTWQTDEFVLRRHDTRWVIAGQTTVAS